MRNNQHGHAAFCQIPHHIKNFADHFRIEGGGGLVEQHDLRLHDEGPCDGHALLLPAGQLTGIGADLVNQADTSQHLARPLVRLPCCLAADFARR